MNTENYYRTAPEGLRDYFDSLPDNVKEQIIRSDIQISTLGELMQVAEHLIKS